MRTIISACLLSLLLTLPGCGTTTAPPGSPAVSDARVVPALQVALTAADHAAIAYVTLPQCPQPNNMLCSEKTTNAKIKVAAQAAYIAVTAADRGTGTASAAQAAIEILVAATPVLQR